MDYVLVVFGHKDIFNSSGLSFDEVVEEVKKYNFYAISEVISKISLRLFSGGAFSRQSQGELIQNIFANSPETIEAISRYSLSIKHPPVVFIEQTIKILQLLALLYSPRSGGEVIPQQKLGDIGNLVLSLTDFAMPQDESWKEIREHWVKQFYSQSEERLIYRLARYQIFFKKLLTRTNQLNFESKFVEATGGVSFSTYTMITFFLLVKWINVRGKNPNIGNDWLICKTKYFQDTKLAIDEIDKVLSLLELPVDNFKNYYDDLNRVFAFETKNIAYNFLFFEKRPLVPIGEGCYVCPSPYSLMDKATDGVYWILEEYLRDKNANLHNTLPMIWGDVFEEYISDRFEGIYGKKATNRKVDIYGKGEIDTLCIGSKLILVIESKFAHWKYRAKVTGLKTDMESTLKQLFSKKKGIGQLNSNIQNMLTTKLNYDVNKDNNKILPILVVGEPMPMDALNRNLYESFAKSEEAWIKFDNRVLPPIILDAEEVEMIEGIGSSDLNLAERLLCGYSEVFKKKNPRGAYSNSDTFKNYLFGHLTPPFPVNSLLDKTFKQMSDVVTLKAFPSSSKTTG